MAKSETFVKLLLWFISLNATLDYVDGSYSNGYADQIQRMASIKASYTLHTAISPTQTYSTASSSSSHVFHVTEYGADPTGRSDSTEAIERAIADAFRKPVEGLLMSGIKSLGGAELHLDGGTYTISRPIRLPEVTAGNFMIHGGSLRASDDFPTDGYILELWSPSSSSLSYEDITLKDLMIDSNFRGGGIAVINSVRTTIDNCYISHFTTNGIFIRDGHETYVRNSFIGQHPNIGGDHREKDFSGIGINIIGNDNAVTDVVIFSASIGVMISGQANVLTGVHCYNKATSLGGTGIYLRSPGLTQTRIINCYLDFTGIVAEDPVQLAITGSFFLGNAFILIKSVKGNINEVTIVDNMFSGDWTGVDIVQLDESNGYKFTNIEQVFIDRNNVRGMRIKSTVARGSTSRTGTTWTVDFSRVLLFPDRIKHVQYSLHTGALFPRHVLRNVKENRVTVESDVAVSATLHVSVEQ